jgi:hypothetical protein
VQEWHGVRDAVIQNRQSNRDDGKGGTRTVLHGEPREDERSGRDVERNRKEPRLKTAATSEESGQYVLFEPALSCTVHFLCLFR